MYLLRCCNFNTGIKIRRYVFSTSTVYFVNIFIYARTHELFYDSSFSPKNYKFDIASRN